MSSFETCCLAGMLLVLPPLPVLMGVLVRWYFARRARRAAVAAFRATAHDFPRARVDRLEVENERLTNELAALRAERGTYRES